MTGGIGSSLQAEVDIAAGGDDLALLRSLGDDLRFVMITSQAVALESSEAAPPTVRVRPSQHDKCERCWHWRSDVNHDPARPGLCGRCATNLFGAGEPRQFA